MDLMKIDENYLKKLSKEDLRAGIVDYIYAHSLIFERLVHLGVLGGDGHRMAQELAVHAQEIIGRNYIVK